MKSIYSRILAGVAALIISFMLVSCASAPKVKPFTLKPLKVENAMAGKSFWRDQVQYPFAVKYAKAKDSKGIEWEVAYMDEYYGMEPNPKVLVLIHGKGAFGGYFGYIMKVALENGLRVIVPDLPYFGKSIPGNIDKSMSRSLQDTRFVINNIIVKQLGVKKATYLGHSLGGQWVLGYVLTYPEAVDKIILESTALEEYPTKFKIGGVDNPIFDDSLHSMNAWENNSFWAGLLNAEYTHDAEWWRNFNYFKSKSPKTGQYEPSKYGFFYNDTEYAHYYTDVITKLTGDKNEFKIYCIESQRDVYSLGVEVRLEDPNSINKRIVNIKVPIFITYGDKDPFMPTRLSGKSDLKLEIIKPFYEKMKKAGNVPVIKFYAGAGHFIHTDFPEDYAQDVASIVRNDSISGPTEDVSSYVASAMKTPEDIQAFFDQFKKDILTKDMKKIEPYYAANFKERGYNRQEFLDALPRTLGFVNDYTFKLTKCQPDTNNPNVVYLEGTVSLGGGMIIPLPDGYQIIKENGRWKWNGNQK
jgi:pimeloyl-ACP methyl ester carboxylesterase